MQETITNQEKSLRLATTEADSVTKLYQSLQIY